MKLFQSENNAGKIKGYSYLCSFPSMLKNTCVSLWAGKTCVCVVRKLCLLASPSFSQMPDCFSWPSKRHGQGGNASVCFALRLIPPVNLLILLFWSCVCVWVCVTEWVHRQVYVDENHTQQLIFSSKYNFAVKIICLFISCTYLLALFF